MSAAAAAAAAAFYRRRRTAAGAAAGEIGALRDKLLDGIDRGFSASSSQRKAVTSALEALKAVNPRPTDGAIGLSGDWELLYTDAPDILGLKNAGPLAELRRVGQQIDAEAGTIENVIEYAPASWLPLDAISARRTGCSSASASPTRSRKARAASARSTPLASTRRPSLA